LALAQEHIVAIGLLTNRDLERLGSGFKRCFPISDDEKFEDLLRAIDRADAAAALRVERSEQAVENSMPPMRQK
jgi:hypothetical protein